MSVFASDHDDFFDIFYVTLTLTGRLVGGQPKDSKLVEGWMRKNMGMEDEELRHRVLVHLHDMGVEVPASASYEEISTALAETAEDIKTQGFKRDEEGRPYIESRHVKAMLKECTNIVFPRIEYKFGQRKGKAKDKIGQLVGGKDGIDWVAERVFVQPDRIPVADDITGVELSIGHPKDKFGESYATIGYFEYVEQPTVEFVVHVRKDCLDHDHWRAIWTQAQVNGLGAMRSQGHGMFLVTRWDKA